MLRIRCPWCGERDEIEFRYRGDARRVRPAADAGLEAFTAYALSSVRRTMAKLASFGVTRDNPVSGALVAAGTVAMALVANAFSSLVV